MDLQAPGRSGQQSAARLMQQMVDACGPHVAASPQLILVCAALYCFQRLLHDTVLVWCNVQHSVGVCGSALFDV